MGSVNHIYLKDHKKKIEDINRRKQVRGTTA